MTKVKAAAIKDSQGRVHTLPPPARHKHIVAMMLRTGYTEPIVGEEGFLLSDGRFVGRQKAMQVAKAANQLIKAPESGELHSEDVW